jgi:hypothetical protein
VKKNKKISSQERNETKMIEKNIACEETYCKRQLNLNRTSRSDPEAPTMQSDPMAGDGPLLDGRSSGASHCLGIWVASKCHEPS